jgi:UDP-N-acetylglucosamine acyltransferase
MPQTVHPTAIIEDGAILERDVTVGPFCVVGSKVVLKAGVELKSHVVIDGRTTLGEGCQVYPFASVGLPPQDLKFQGEDSQLEIGSGTVIREYATVSPGTASGRLLTKVGEKCFLMVGTHVAHDCFLGDNVIMVNNSTLGGHVKVGNNVIIGGLAAIHQFVRIGDHAFIGGMAGVEQDVIPYGMVVGERASLNGLNIVGLKRRGYSREDIHLLRGIYRHLFESVDGSLSQRLQSLRSAHSSNSIAASLLDFIDLDSDRKILKPKGSHA